MTTGQFKIALMPGVSHKDVGYVRFYAMTPKAVAEGKVENLPGSSLNYFGGKTDGQYQVVKRWAIENGLRFAQLPLFDDCTSFQHSASGVTWPPSSSRPSLRVPRKA